MKKWLLLLSLAAIAGVFAGCKGQDQAIDDREAGIQKGVQENAKNRAPGEGPGN